MPLVHINYVPFAATLAATGLIQDKKSNPAARPCSVGHSFRRRSVRMFSSHSTGLLKTAFRPALAICGLALAAGCGDKTAGAPATDAAAAIAECTEVLSPLVETDVFAGAEQPSSAGHLLALAFERASYSAFDSVKERPRADIRQLVLTVAGQTGFYCHLLSPEGYTAGSMSTFGGGRQLTYARRVSDDQIEITASTSARGDPSILRLKANPDDQTVQTFIASEGGERPLAGYRLLQSDDGQRAICDRSSGFLQTLATDGRVVQQQLYGCEALDFADPPPAREVTGVRFDIHGNRIAEDWVDENGNSGQLLFDPTVNDRGDWVTRRAENVSASTSVRRNPVLQHRSIVYRDPQD